MSLLSFAALLVSHLLRKHCRDLGVCLCVGLHKGVLNVRNTAVVPFRQKQDSADILLEQKVILL